jgi:hypothetical protein
MSKPPARDFILRPRSLTRSIVLVIVCAFLYPASSQAQAPVQTQAEKRGKQLIDQAVQALGGENFLNMQDRIETGRAYSYYRDQISGLSIAKIYTRYITVAPGKSGEEVAQREREAFGKNEDSSVLFTENGGWEINWRGSKELEKERLDRYRDTTLRNVLYIFRQRLKEPGMIFESRGAEVFENKPVDIVDITDSQNRVVTVYLHQSTKLPVRQLYAHHNALTKERDEEVTLFSRYRDVGGGVQWPLQMRRERNGDKTYEIFSESVSINQNLTDDLFSLPTGNEKATQKPKKKK